MKRIISALLLLVVAWPVAEARAFDGERRGFVMGGGVMVAPYLGAKTDQDNFPENDDAGAGLQIMLGYAWSERNMIVFERSVAVSNSSFRGVEYSAFHGFTGISWYHYFGRAGQTPFATAGAGFFTYGFEDYDSDFDGWHDDGGAIQLGGGYEFSRHWQVGVYAVGGRTEYMDADFDHVLVATMLTGVLF